MSSTCTHSSPPCAHCRIAELEAAAKHRVRRGCDVNCLKVCGGHCDCGNDELAALLEVKDE